MRAVSILATPARMAARIIPGALLTAKGFLWVLWCNVFLLWVIIPSGGLVRLTASGLGCPDWPLCHGGVVPPTSEHPIIEFTNRALSGVVVVVAVLVWLIALMAPTASRAVRALTLTAALMTIGQIPLGALTVLSGLNPVMVGSHFLLSMCALAAGIMAVVFYRDSARGWSRTWDRRRGPFSGLGALALLTVVITGILVTASGPHAGAATVTDRFSNLQLTIWLHVRAVGLLVVLMGVLAAWAWRERPRDPLVLRLIGVFLPLLIVQIAIGEYQFRHGLPWQVVAVHVPVAGLVWGIGLVMAWCIARPPTRTTSR